MLHWPQAPAAGQGRPPLQPTPYHHVSTSLLDLQIDQERLLQDNPGVGPSLVFCRDLCLDLEPPLPV